MAGCRIHSVFGASLFSVAALFFLSGVFSCGGDSGTSGGGPTSSSLDTPPSDTAFSFSLPTYIPDNISSTTNTLEFALTPMDWWGKAYNPSGSRFEPSKQYVESVIERSVSIGSSHIFFNQFYVLHTDYTIHEQPYEGAMTATVPEMTDFVTRARNAGHSKVSLWVNLYGQTSTVTSQIADLHISPVPATIQGLLSEWRSTITAVAADAETAGFDSLVIDPRDIYFFFTPATYASEWQDILDDVDLIFSGDILMYGGRGTLIDFAAAVSGIDGFIVDEGNISHLAAVTDEDLGDLTDAWEDYLTDSNMVADLCALKPTWILLLIPSYDGSLQGGWVEPGAEYPSGLYTPDYKEQALAYEAFFRAVYQNPSIGIHGAITYGYWWSNSIYPNHYWQRSDIAHSIRTKDAESVFYRWSQLFNQ